ncbi:MAG TPA: hypothetical protein VHW01_06815, partial [Polyangiaceae bacterium]|nr:hypothetical protein [Polyangiaceae bacterium]
LNSFGGSHVPGRGLTVGQQGVTPDDTAAMRQLFKMPAPWKPAGTMQQMAVISFSGGFTAPDGTWATNVGRLNTGSAYRFWVLQ